MLKKVKEYSDYRKNRKTAKRELAKIVATLCTNTERFLAILQYLADLPPQDIQKILVHAMVETNEAIKDEAHNSNP